MVIIDGGKKLVSFLFDIFVFTVVCLSLSLSLSLSLPPLISDSVS